MDTDPRTHATLELILAFHGEGRDFAALEQSDPEHAARLIDAQVLHDEGDDSDATVAGLYGDDDDEKDGPTDEEIEESDIADLDDGDPTDSELDLMPDAEPHAEPEEDDEND